MHTGGQIIQCDICFQLFSRNYFLKTHMSIHTEEKNYKCEQCDKAFADKSAKRTHMISHTGG
jgi:KRAB domain-containing zinc finger protein